MRFDAVTLENVRINRTLCQKFDSFQLASLFFKDANEFRTDDFSFLFRFFYAGQLVQEALGRVNIDQISLHLIAEHFDNLLRFSFAQQTVIDVHTNQLRSDRANQ